MTRLSLLPVRLLAVALALVLATVAAPRAFAQDAPQLPDGVTAGATASFTNDTDFSQLSFTVLQFEDDDAAEAGFDAVVSLSEDSFASLGDLTGSGTPAAAPEITEVTDIEGLDDIGDQRRLTQVTITDGIDVTQLYVRDGDSVQYWASISTDLSGLTGEATTPVASPAAGSPAELLVGIAGPWFDGGFADDAPLTEQLPSQDVVPAGFTETSRQEETVPGS